MILWNSRATFKQRINWRQRIISINWGSKRENWRFWQLIQQNKLHHQLQIGQKLLMKFQMRKEVKDRILLIKFLVNFIHLDPRINLSRARSASFSKYTHDGYFDGASRGNPGVGSIGYVLRYSQSTVFSKGFFIKQKITCNQAEIFSLSNLLAQSYCNDIRNLRVYGDSKLAISFMSDVYKVKNDNILTLVNGCKEIASRFQRVSYHHINRKFNKLADKMAEDALISVGFKRKKETK